MEKGPYQMPGNNIGSHSSDLRGAIIGVFSEYYGGIIPKDSPHFFIQADTCWNLNISFLSRKGDVLTIRNIKQADVELLETFKEELGEESRELFCPYPWNNPDELNEAIVGAIKKSINCIDASYIITNGKSVGHFFLWGAGGNSHSLRHDVDIPELGVAIADLYQGGGLGLLAVRILQEVAKNLGRDAIELTTAFSNDVGWNIYRKAGFMYTGNIKNPLEVDVLLASTGQVVAPRYREERQMVYVINSEKLEIILHYLNLKRNS